MSAHEFTLDAYVFLLQRAKDLHRIISPKSEIFEQSDGVVWRHDVDFSLRKATELSRIDANFGITSVFFINMHSDTYNVRSALGRRQLLSIIECGHSIGIHLDSEFHGGFQSVSQLEHALNFEVQQFRENFSVTPDSFSFHNPTVSELCFEERRYSNLLNYYSRDFKERFKYVSDSNGYWRFDSILNVINQSNTPLLHVLTHPEWWAERPLAPRERLAKVMFDDAIEDLSHYDQAIVKFARENISEFPEEDVKMNAQESGIRAFNHIYRSGSE